MIIFLGDSFTWGQGISFERWILEENKTPQVCNQFLPAGQFEQELFSYKDDMFRKQYHFPNLVAKHFDSSYVTQFGNGGTNKNISKMLLNLGNQFGSNIRRSVKFFVIQFTDFGRSLDGGEMIIDDFETIMETQVHEIDKNCKHWGLEWYGFSWRSDIGEVLQTKYKQNYIPLIYNNKEYNNFGDILDLENNLSIKKKYNNLLSDEHFSINGHEFIAKNIISKIEKVSNPKLFKN